MYCKKCGKQLDDDAKVCDKCGEKQGKSKGMIAIIAVLCLLCIGLTVGIVLVLNKDNSKSSKTNKTSSSKEIENKDDSNKDDEDQNAGSGEEITSSEDADGSSNGSGDSGETTAAGDGSSDASDGSGSSDFDATVTPVTDEEIQAAQEAVKNYYNAVTVDDYINGVPTAFKEALMKTYDVADDSELREKVQDMLDDIDVQYQEEFSTNLSQCVATVTFNDYEEIDADSVAEASNQMKEEWKDEDLSDLYKMVRFSIRYELKDQNGNILEESDDVKVTAFGYEGKWYSIDVLYMVDYAASAQEVTVDAGDTIGLS